MLEVAEAAAGAGAEVVRSSELGAEGALKGAASGDYVTDIDRAAEAAVVGVLRDQSPDVAVLAEEGGGEAAERYWVVDPLDGTTNFMHGFPLVGVAVGLVERGRPVAGVVRAPFLGETYAGARGLGAEVRRASGSTSALRVSGRDPGEAVVGTGFPFRRKDRLQRYLAMFGRCLERFEDLRRPGAASLDLAWTSAGVFDGFFELGLAPWDVAAGGLLVEEAGGRVTDWQGGDSWLTTGNILAGPPQVHAALLELARETDGVRSR
jgi:myo-inositol-1(or 4)-monophosphatase